LGRRKPGGSMGGRWELPGGKREPGESHPEALVREFLEEFGLRIEVGERLAATQFVNHGKRHEVVAYKIKATLPIPFLLEHVEVSWFAPDRLPEHIVDSDAELLAQIKKV
jgi:8-oxo-dGTP diphosphatase